MMARRLFILVPSLQPSGPVKGAVALANSLVSIREVILVHLKPGEGVDAPLDDRVGVASLAEGGSFAGKVSAYRRLLVGAGGRARVASLSFCYSADMVNLLCRRQALTGSSIRGNLLHNYRLDYGVLGIPLAMTHLATMRGFDQVVAMNAAMADQVRIYAGRRPSIIPNFIDEGPLEAYREKDRNEGALRFVFVGSLTIRKRPMVLLNAICELHRRKVQARLDIIGEGPMRTQLEEGITRLGLGGLVALHGHQSVPYDLLARADALVLPSSSEGVSRAVLEGLHLDIPCVLRDVDGNAELVQRGENGALFDRDEELASVMQEVAVWSRNRKGARASLLPPSCRQALAAQRYIALLESGHDVS